MVEERPFVHAPEEARPPSGLQKVMFWLGMAFLAFLLFAQVVAIMRGRDSGSVYFTVAQTIALVASVYLWFSMTLVVSGEDVVLDDAVAAPQLPSKGQTAVYRLTQLVLLGLGVVFLVGAIVYWYAWWPQWMDADWNDQDEYSLLEASMMAVGAVLMLTASSALYRKRKRIVVAYRFWLQSQDS